MLVVAQDTKLRHGACARLAAAGFEVDTTDDGLFAVMTAHRDPPDLIILSQSVRGLAVDKLLGLLRSDRRVAGVPIVPLAVYDDSDATGALPVIAPRSGQPAA